MLQLLLFIVPLGLDTLGVAVSLGMKAVRIKDAGQAVPDWLRSALLFALAETVMPLVGLGVGYATSTLVSEIMRFVGPLLLIGVGLWELVGEVRELLEKRGQKSRPSSTQTPESRSAPLATWTRQLLLALSISLDELAVGFSLGTVTVRSGKTLSPLLVCVLIGLQGFLMTLIGLTLGRLLGRTMKPLQQWSEWLSAILLIGLGIWLLIRSD